MEPESMLWLTGAAIVAWLILSLGSLWAARSIFPGSGMPDRMAETLLKSIVLQSQPLIAILGIGVLSSLLLSKTVTPAEGLPIISGLLSAVVGFAIGRHERKDADSKR